jgi:hypothetical protein
MVKLNNGLPIPAWSWHDLRRTAASGMGALGIAPHIIEAILNHRSGTIRGVARTYDRHTYIPEKLHALTTWAAHLDRLEHVDNVVQLRQ